MAKTTKKFKIPGGVGRPIKYPFAKLRVGQFIFMKVSIDDAVSRAWYWSKKLGHKYTCRTYRDGVRAWRIE